MCEHATYVDVKGMAEGIKGTWYLKQVGSVSGIIHGKKCIVFLG